MLRISKLTDYAIIILSYLAHEGAAMTSAASIARDSHLTGQTVSKLLKILAKSGLVLSARGAGGGYQLAYPAEKITLADVVSAIEGKVAMTECCAAINLCSLDSLCGIKENWQVINKIILTALAGVSLRDMMQPLHSHPLALRGIPIQVKGLVHGK
jgi:FeS assembly SUF system regulator